MVDKVPKVVIVGGSFAGVNAVKGLDSLGSKIHLTLIEKRDHFFLNFASVRGITQQGFADSLFIPYSKLFRSQENREIKQAIVSDVYKNHIVLENGEKVDFDYLIVATGTSNSSPFKVKQNTKVESLEEFSKIQKAIQGAKSVILVGGGIVGIETAGEIKTDFPNIEVTIITSHDDIILPNEKQKNYLKTQMKELGINIIYNERISSQIPDYSLTPLTITGKSGKVYSADIVLKTIGNTANSSLMNSLSRESGTRLLDDQSRIIVSPSLQVTGFTNIFAIGDVANISTETNYYHAQNEGSLAASNIASLISKPNNNLKQYIAKPSPYSVISLGRNAGSSVLPFGTFGAFTTRMLKSKGLFVAKYWGEMNQKYVA